MGLIYSRIYGVAFPRRGQERLERRAEVAADVGVEFRQGHEKVEHVADLRVSNARNLVAKIYQQHKPFCRSKELGRSVYVALVDPGVRPDYRHGSWTPVKQSAGGILENIRQALVLKARANRGFDLFFVHPRINSRRRPMHFIDRSSRLFERFFSRLVRFSIT